MHQSDPGVKFPPACKGGDWPNQVHGKDLLATILWAPTGLTLFSSCSCATQTHWTWGTAVNGAHQIPII